MTDTIDTPGYQETLQRSFKALYDSGRDSWTTEEAMQHLVPLLHDGLGEPGRVLEVGVGRGRDTETLLGLGHRVVAVDLVRLPEWDEVAARWSEQVRFVAGDVRDLADDERFDAVLDNGVLHHQLPQDYPAYLATLRRQLRPGGLLAVSLFARAEEESEGKLHEAHDGRLSREFTAEEADTLLAESGFAVVSTRRVQRGRPDWTYLLVLARSQEN
ncbi:class I SAM-dependent methyltransferase [Streptomyces stramineus]|uniref:1,6-didemethyltoxoflavin N1-methyltransferase n=1 Tax=Streptomyces stramineus TaxID=173861 RepID=A0ABN1ALN2_9ACTN